MTQRIPPQLSPRMLSTEEILPTTQKVLDRFRAVHNAVVHDVTLSEACFRNVIKPFIDVENLNNGDIQAVAMLRYASPSQESREASEAAVRLLGKYSSEFTASEDIFLLVQAVHNRGETLDFESSKYLNNLVTDFKRCGHGLLSGSQIKQYLETRDQIDSLRQEYNRNVREEDGGIWFSQEDLDGVLEEDMARFGINQKQLQLRYVHFRNAEIDSVLKFATNSSTREKMYVANAHRLPQNVDLFKRIILLRDQNARLLNYSSHANFRLEKRVAKTVEWVSNLLEGLEKSLLPKGKEEIQALLQLKKEYIAEHSNKDERYIDMVTPWDYAFYSRLALDSLEVDHEKISEYFPLQHSISAMLNIFAACLQLKFVPAPADLVSDSIWHEDVEAWCVWDERPASNGSFVGYLFTDLLWRPGKYKGSQNVTLQSGYVRDDGTRVYPATILMCCFPRATSSSCTLLKHREIVSMFHELGHGIHDLVSRTAYTRFHGHRAPPDFAEAPSVMLENWCWLKDELKRMSCHYTQLDKSYLKKWQEAHSEQQIPPETIPDSMVDALVQSRDLNRATWFLRQVALSRFDMVVHSPSSHQACEEMVPTGIYCDILEELMSLPHPKPHDRGHPHADFGHLVSGYDAGYYSYLAAHVFAADMYQTAFAREPRNQTVWEKYRRIVLEPGGSTDELEILETFLGHAPDPKTLLRSFGSS